MNDSQAKMPGDARASNTSPYCRQARQALRQSPAVIMSTYSGTTADKPSMATGSSNQGGINAQ